MRFLQQHPLMGRRWFNVNVRPISFIVIYSYFHTDEASTMQCKGLCFFIFAFQERVLYVQYLWLCISLDISAWWRAQRLCTKWLTVALAAGSDPPWGENILALHKFLTRFQIADVSILFSAPAALNSQWESPMICSCTRTHSHNTHLPLKIRNTHSKLLAH